MIDEKAGLVGADKTGRGDNTDAGRSSRQYRERERQRARIRGERSSWVWQALLGALDGQISAGLDSIGSPHSLLACLLASAARLSIALPQLLPARMAADTEAETLISLEKMTEVPY